MLKYWYLTKEIIVTFLWINKMWIWSKISILTFFFMASTYYQSLQEILSNTRSRATIIPSFSLDNLVLICATEKSLWTISPLINMHIYAQFKTPQHALNFFFNFWEIEPVILFFATIKHMKSCKNGNKKY